jgi:8-oxo-dGTP diphosphatase/2-hydroxy-dATP diphosphatase
MATKIMTICCVHTDSWILLGEIKKEGPLKGKFNGFGGKVEEGETIESAAKRELLEECCIVPLDMRKIGIINFIFDEEGNPFSGKPELEVHIYGVTEFEGEPTETNEMLPMWFNYDSIPYGKMWPDDQYWLPLVFEGKSFRGTFYLKDTESIKHYELKEVDVSEL